MTLEEAKNLLRTAVKSELRDHAFGDCEVEWTIEDSNLAVGYFGGGERSVSIRTSDTTSASFKDNEADELRKCFAKELVERNDETGPDNFVEGQVMTGLTLDGVRKELTGD